MHERRFTRGTAKSCAWNVYHDVLVHFPTKMLVRISIERDFEGKEFEGIDILKGTKKYSSTLWFFLERTGNRSLSSHVIIYSNEKTWPTPQV